MKKKILPIIEPLATGFILKKKRKHFIIPYDCE